MKRRIVRQIYVSMGGTSIIRYWVGISLRWILVVDFEGFRFLKMYKRFGVLKVKEWVFYVDEIIG